MNDTANRANEECQNKRLLPGDVSSQPLCNRPKQLQAKIECNSMMTFGHMLESGIQDVQKAIASGTALLNAHKSE